MIINRSLARGLRSIDNTSGGEWLALYPYQLAGAVQAMQKILVIEDEQQILVETVETLLETDRFEVEAADDGASGLKLTYSYGPSLILCDTTLPDGDEFTVLRQVRSDPAIAHIPLILMSAKATWAAVREGMELGADDFLMKPVLPLDLIAAVDSRLRRFEQIAYTAEKDLEKAKHSLLQMVTHELKTPLVPINTAVEIISRQMGQLSPEQLEELLGTISAGSRRLSRLIEQMVLITQLEAGVLCQEALVENGVRLRLWDILLVAIDMARRFAYRHPDVSIHLEERDTEAPVIADKSALKQALAELVTNALSFSPPNGEVVIAQWQAGGEIWISIVDQGPGIPPDQLQLVLKGFYQVDRERQDQQGVGLGLPLAYRVIEAHGGKLELRSVVGRGTQVIVSLPIAGGARLQQSQLPVK